jgi:hypothetical protein
MFLYIIHCPRFLIETHNISEIGFCLRLQVGPTQLSPIDKASPYLRTPAQTRDAVLMPSTTETICES